MASTTETIESFVSTRLNPILFFDEFVFSSTRFTPPQSTEVEFADAVVMLGDVLLVFQIKERSGKDAGDIETERRWFGSKVLRRATKQIRDTLRHLESGTEIRVPNRRGHMFDLAANKYRRIIKVIMYSPVATLPSDCRQIRCHVSDTAGFIHVISERDYYHVARLLRVPEEVVRYFEHRERVLTDFSDQCSSLTEAHIAGDFIEPSASGPTALSAKLLQRVVDDSIAWDLAPLLSNIRNHLSDPNVSNEYYGIVLEFARLPRSGWRIAKERILRCIDIVNRDGAALPYRFSHPDSDCGFVFIPAMSEFVRGPDWPAVRLGILRNVMSAHKYDGKHSKCVGVMIAKDGDYFDIFWALIESEWQSDPEMDEIIKQLELRPISARPVSGFYVSK